MIASSMTHEHSLIPLPIPQLPYVVRSAWTTRVRRAWIVLIAATACFVLDAAAPRAAARIWIVNGANPRASDSGQGTVGQPFRSINAAAQVAGPGDTIRVAPGIYRERVSPARGGEQGRPIVYEAIKRGTAIVRGSDVFAPRWERVDDPGATGAFRASLPSTLFAGDNPFHHAISIDGEDHCEEVRPARGNLRPVLGEVFVNGVPYGQVTTAVALAKQEGTWMAPADGASIVVHFPRGADPAKCTVEITTRDRIFAPHHRGLGYIHVKGFVFEHCANQGPFPQRGAVSMRSGHAWVIEENVIRFAATIGLDCGGEYWDGAKIPDTVPEERKLIIGGHHVIRDNDISDNGMCGIAGWTLRDSTIEFNRIERNNRRRFPEPGGAWEEWAGIKLHNSNALIRGNLIRDNLAFGIWMDNGYGNARVTSNLMLRNRGAGVFLELGASPGNPCAITNNVIGSTTPLPGGFYIGSGIYTHDASDILIARNLVFGNAGFGLLMRTISDRQAGGKLAETSRARIGANLFANNAAGAISLPYPNRRSAGLASDGNAFWSNRSAREYFAINKVQDSFRMEDVGRELHERLAGAGVPAERLPVPARWAQDPRLTLEQWRLLMSMDQKSVEGEITVRCDDQVLPARLHVSVDPRVVELCSGSDRPVNSVTGRPVPPENATADTLHQLRAGENTLVLSEGGHAGSGE